MFFFFLLVNDIQELKLEISFLISLALCAPFAKHLATIQLNGFLISVLKETFSPVLQVKLHKRKLSKASSGRPERHTQHASPSSCRIPTLPPCYCLSCTFPICPSDTSVPLMTYIGLLFQPHPPVGSGGDVYHLLYVGGGGDPHNSFPTIWSQFLWCFRNLLYLQILRFYPG